ncbi:MAG: ABC transporter ATP-binding protein [Gemmatimonadaceae bacterium]|nr:ABC transporter ATP-binding protein [Gemmatimonadaceae bacterium]
MTAAPLALRGIHVRFGETVALDDVSLTVRPGTIHAVLGENGAGKSTLMRVAFGLQRPSAGALLHDDRPVTIATPRDAMRLGIGMVHQHFVLVPAFTVAESVALGDATLDLSATRAKIAALSAETGLAVDPDARIDSLGVGAQQRVEIIRALARDARVLLLDEPTAVLTATEAEELLAWARRFVEQGGAVVLITHKLREALVVADEITVLQRGRVTLSAARAAVDEATVLRAMVGELPTAVPRAAPTPTGAPVFAFAGLELRDARGIVRLRGAKGEVRAGEIVAIAGVEGAGQRELLRALAGRLAPSAGTLSRPHACGWVPEDRLHDAVIPSFTLTENLALRGASERRGTIDWPSLAREAQALLAAHDVRASGADAPMRALSGGNQQKFVMARERAEGARALVAENPTRGLDVRATAAVHDALRALRGAGGAVVCFSTDLDEVLALADRVYVCYNGALVETPVAADLVARAMVGAS